MPAAPAIVLAAERGTEVRFSAPVFDRHRPYGVVRAAHAVPPERIKLAELAALERSGDVGALVGAFALNGDLASAERIAKEPPRSAATLTDRAAIELLRIDSAPELVAGPSWDVGAQRALSLTTDALRIAPGYAQAKWNQAVALKRLGLSLVAARVFGELATAREVGWADEARANAEALHDSYRRETDDWRRVKADADRMVLGGQVLSSNAVARAPSLARDAFYQALAMAITSQRIDELAPVARALDAAFATTELGDLLARVKASDLRPRAALAAALKAVVERHSSAEAVEALRAQAVRLGMRDIALASFLAVDEDDMLDADLAMLDKLVTQSPDPWWRLVALARRAFVAEFVHRDYPAVYAAARLSAPLCKAIRSAWCWRIMLFAGGASSQMGRADLAIEQLADARRQTKDAAAWDSEVDAIDVLGQAIANRLAEDIDASSVAGAYLEEVSLRRPTCGKRLQRLDFAADLALQYHRVGEAARLRGEADDLERGTCSKASLRLNGETVRLRLVLLGRASVATLRGNLQTLTADGQPSRRLYIDFLEAAGMLAEDRPRGEALLRKVIATATEDPARMHAALVRANAFDVLIESVAASGDASAVLALLGERLGAAALGRCVLGVAAANRQVVALLDADGKPAIETRDVPEGVRMIPAADVVSPVLRARLAGCRRVDVLASGPYFGAARLLGSDTAWVYHTGTPRAPRAFDPTHELVVSDVTPPEELHLPALQPVAGGPGAEILRGPRATPANVLAAMKTASLVVIVAHGLTDANEPTAASLILSPDAQGDYLLTASKVSSAQLAGSPIVILAGCHAGRVQVSAEPWSLATSFLQAGARVVIAPTDPIPDASANEVFRSLVQRIRTGSDAVEALAAERHTRGAAAAWLSSVVVFE